MRILSKFTLTIVLILMLLTAYSQQNSFFKDIDKTFGLSSTKNFDTNYYTIAKNGWMLNLNNNFSGFILNAKMKNVPFHNEVTMNLHSAFNYQLSATFGYRNLILGYSIANIYGKGKDFTLSLSSNSWGVEFRRLESDDFSGESESSLSESNMKINEGDIKVKTRYLRAYHVFNSKKYSTAAAIDQRCVQKKSAGSLLFYTNYAIQNISFYNPELINRFKGIHSLEYSQGELGLGYGYNFTPNQGKLLLHASIIPMFVVLTSEYANDNTLTELQTTHKYFFNAMGRFTINYRFNDNLGLCLSAFLNTNRFSAQNDLTINLYDYLIKASLCFRI
ncbi:MAG: DUF4421 family protein [Bacteroidales bacterium]|nr:DUF4421 family protein [Bacteroidales bacterium]